VVSGWCIRMPAAYQPLQPAAYSRQARSKPSWFRNRLPSQPPTSYAGYDAMSYVRPATALI
jgi:hypothetical protein